MIVLTGAAGFIGVKHIKGESEDNKDFSEIIEQAKKCAPPTEIETGEIIGGFAHNQVLSLADAVVEAVKTGAIKKFFVMAGCDGRAKSRDYYTDFAKALPKIRKEKSIMPKLKTHSGAKKRFNLTKTGKVKRAHAYKSHILTKKTTKRTRHLRATAYADQTNVDAIKKMIPYK